jgi:hypothetical protein
MICNSSESSSPKQKEEEEDHVAGSSDPIPHLDIQCLGKCCH